MSRNQPSFQSIFYRIKVSSANKRSWRRHGIKLSAISAIWKRPGMEIGGEKVGDKDGKQGEGEDRGEKEGERDR